MSDTGSNTYHFQGGFSTITQMDNNSFNSLILWLLTNQSYNKLFSTQSDSIVTRLNDYIVSHNVDVVNELKAMGLTDEQATQIQEYVTNGFDSTLRKKQAQDLAIAAAQHNGYWDGVKTAAIGVAFLIGVAIVFILVRGNVKVPVRIRKRKKEEVKLNLDNIFGM
jgi:hypothetical protein